jgi:hypothetical protein
MIKTKIFQVLKAMNMKMAVFLDVARAILQILTHVSEERIASMIRVPKTTLCKIQEEGLVEGKNTYLHL